MLFQEMAVIATLLKLVANPLRIPFSWVPLFGIASWDGRVGVRRLYAFKTRRIVLGIVPPDTRDMSKTGCATYRWLSKIALFSALTSPAFAEDTGRFVPFEARSGFSRWINDPSVGL